MARPCAVPERPGAELSSAGRHARPCTSGDQLLGWPRNSFGGNRTYGNLFMLALVVVVPGSMADARDVDGRLDGAGEHGLALQLGERKAVGTS